MPKATRRSSKPGHAGKSQQAGSVGLTKPPSDLASRLRGLYGRVARQVGVHPSYVSRVARGERQSAVVHAALRRELAKIVDRATRQEILGPRASRQKSRKR